MGSFQYFLLYICPPPGKITANQVALPELGIHCFLFFAKLTLSFFWLSASNTGEDNFLILRWFSSAKLSEMAIESFLRISVSDTSLIDNLFLRAAASCAYTQPTPVCVKQTSRHIIFQ